MRFSASPGQEGRLVILSFCCVSHPNWILFVYFANAAVQGGPASW